jgi:putative endonuclease
MLFVVPHYVYLAKCSDNSLYCGTCVDPVAREAKHNAGKGAKYTRGRRPVKFVYVKKSRGLSAARKLEAKVKRMSRDEKEQLVKGTLKP